MTASGLDRLGGSTIYQIFLRPFTHEGTIAAAEKHLAAIADLGIKIVYLCPVAFADRDENRDNWSPRQKQSGCNNPRNPYRIADFTAIDPEYGTEDDLKSFIRTAHELGMKVLLDLVYYHAGPGFGAAHPDFVKGDGEYCFPCLDFSSEGLRAYLAENMRYYAIDLDADGFRCDVGDKIPMDFWGPVTEQLRRIKPDLIMFCEGEHRAVEEQSGGVFDLNYNFSWCYACRDVYNGKEPVTLLPAVWKNNARYARYFDNHDVANDAYDERLEKTKGAKAIESLIFLSFMIDGVPFLYNGVEFCDSNRHSIFANPGQFTIDRSNDAPVRKALIRKLVALRLAEPLLHQGSTQWHEVRNDLLHFTRGDRIECFINLSEGPAKITIPEDAEVLAASVDTASPELQLGSYGFAAYKI